LPPKRLAGENLDNRDEDDADDDEDARLALKESASALSPHHRVTYSADLRVRVAGKL
jgi:hypothetical protein